MSTSEGRWVWNGNWCQWCGKQVKVWVSDYDDSLEYDDATYCSIMCSFEAVAFVMRHR